MGTVGPLMARSLARVEAAPGLAERTLVMAALSAEDHGQDLPAVVQVRPDPPHPGETWPEYADRTRERLRPLQGKLADLLGAESTPLLAANALQIRLRPEQVALVAEDDRVEMVELDPLLPATMMDDVHNDLDLPGFHQRNPGTDGAGARVAVLDSGIDLRHPFLRVADSVSTCGESDEIPGRHGTHCAGSIASRDSQYPGVAPGVDLINVKVLRASGLGQPTFITRGIDAALDFGAHVLSMSIGFNHLPPWSDGGHGWYCPDGRCQLCVAVDNAVSFDGVVVVVAAGNEHERAVRLRNRGFGGTFDTELGCPGQAREAITVGAVTKRTFDLAGFSSRGPTAYGAVKPSLVAPGVNVRSTVPVPRNAAGHPIANPSRAVLFARESGTSMATPMVAGALALLIQRHQQDGHAWTPHSLRQELLARGIQPLPLQLTEGGAGRLSLQGL